MNQDTVLMVIGGVLSFVVVVGIVILHRLYKWIGRRCDCGEVIQNYHGSKIFLPTGEELNPSKVPNRQIRELLHDFSLVALKKFLHEFRWWRRNAMSVTFSVCPCCGGIDEKTKKRIPYIKVVTISCRPISLWHLLWVWHTKPKQFQDNVLITFHIGEFVRELYRKKYPPASISEVERNPPLKFTWSRKDRSHEQL